MSAIAGWKQRIAQIAGAAGTMAANPPPAAQSASHAASPASRRPTDQMQTPRASSTGERLATGTLLALQAPLVSGLAVGAVALSALGGCGDDEDASEGAGGGSGLPGWVEEKEKEEEAPFCGRTPQEPYAWEFVPMTAVNAEVVTLDGTPVEGVEVHLRGMNEATNDVYTDENGIAFRRQLNLGEVAEPHILVGSYEGGSRTALIAYPTDSGVRPQAVHFPLSHGHVEANELSFLTDDVRVTLADGTTTKFKTPNILFQMDQEFAAAVVDGSAAERVAPSEGFAALVPMTPTRNICPPAQLSVRNTVGLPADSEVDLFIQELYYEFDGSGARTFLGKFGSWVRVSGGRVSEDGKTIDSTEGIPAIQTVGIKLAE